MRAGLLLALAGTLAVILLGSPAAAQNQPPSPPSPPPPGHAVAPLTPAQLDRLTAPIALYPDPLVALILMAATYPLEVVEADRWLQQPANAALRGDALAAALGPLSWDPSVKSLAAFPQILAMMDKYLTWTEQLGDAFLAGQPAIMDSVQRLRRRAEAAGGLRSTPEVAVSNDDGPIVIEPANPDIVYVPVYDPNTVYGAWPNPDQPPYDVAGLTPSVVTGPPEVGWLEVVAVAPLWLTNRCDWRRHRIDLDIDRFNALNFRQPAIASSVWQHQPAHRRGVPYRDPTVQARFPAAAATEARPAPQSRPAALRAPLAPAAAGGGHPPSVIAGRPPPPQIMHAPSAAIARPPVVLRGTASAVPSFGRSVEPPAPALRGQMLGGQAGRVFTPAPLVAMPVPNFAPVPKALAPAPALKAAPALEGIGEHK